MPNQSNFVNSSPQKGSVLFLKNIFHSTFDFSFCFSFSLENLTCLDWSAYLTTLELTLSKISEKEKQKLKSKMVRPPILARGEYQSRAMIPSDYVAAV